MSATTVQLGYLPVNRGDWEENHASDLQNETETRYYKDNIVSYKGSAFIANPPGYDRVSNPTAYITTPPFDEGQTQQLNTGWKLFVDAKTYVDEQLDLIVNGTPSEAINSMQAIINFLDQYTQDDSLYDILHTMQESLDDLNERMGGYTLTEVSESDMEAMIANRTTDEHTLYLVLEDNEEEEEEES